MPSKTDAHLGLRLRQRRWMLGLTQQQLGDRVGIKFQQVQKYETGQNRISASRLWELAGAVDVPVSYFFEGLDGDAPAAGAGLTDVKSTPQGDLLADREAAELVRSYYALPETQRRRLFDFMRSVAELASGAQAEPAQMSEPTPLKANGGPRLKIG